MGAISHTTQGGMGPLRGRRSQAAAEEVCAVALSDAVGVVARLTGDLPEAGGAVSCNSPDDLPDAQLPTYGHDHTQT